MFEQARSLKPRPGGIRLPPSATRILSHWGVEKELAQKASITPSSSILDSECPEHRQFWHILGRGRMHATSDSKLTGRGFVPSKSENGKADCPVCMENGPHRGDGFVVLHDARKPNLLPAYFRRLTLNSTMDSMRTYLKFSFASLRLQERACILA